MNRACLGAALAIGILSRAGTVDAYDLQMTPEGMPVRWSDAEVVFHLELDDHDAHLHKGEAAAAASRALATWSEAGGPFLIGEEGDGKPHDRDRDRDEHIIRFTRDIDDPDIDPRALALTRLRYDPDSGAITGVSITVNAAAFRWAAGGDCDDEYDLESTLAHEIGHALGLRHSLVAGATMFTRPQPCDGSRRDLAQDDLDGIAALYGNTSVQGGTPGDVADSVAAGCSASGSRGGASSGLAALLLVIVALLVNRSCGAGAMARERRRARRR